MGGRAQQFNTHWIAAPWADSTSHVWFRHTYLAQGRPQQARITVVSTGYYKLYVNEHNVGTAAFYPSRKAYSDNAVAMDFDVTRYMRSDTNVVAILYAPTYAHANDRQLSVVFHGRTADERPFAHFSNEDWLCKPANSAINSMGGETTDGRRHTTSWKAPAFDPALWLPARPTHAVAADTIALCTPASPLPTIAKRRGSLYFDTQPDGVEYEFGEAFRGRVRLTLREAQHGETIRLGNTIYICNGNLDEQASPIFSTDTYRRVRITGDKWFRREQITDIEAIEISPISPGHYWP